MKLLKHKSWNNSARWLASNDKREIYCIIGTVEDLKKMKILEDCNAPNELWCYMCEDGFAQFFKFRDTMLKAAMKEAPLHLREDEEDEATY